MRRLPSRSGIDRIAPQAVESFIRQAGWTKIGEIANHTSVWSYPADPAVPHILVPRSKELADYERRISDVLDVLEDVTGRSITGLLDQILTSLDDVAYLSLDSPDLASGTIPFLDGQSFFHNSLELLKCAVAGLVDPRPFYPTRKPPRVDSYIRNVRLGQTRVGSYQIQIISKRMAVPIDFGTGVQAVPFERKAVIGLVGAMEALVEAAQTAKSLESLEPFSEAVERGVSANLCKSVLGMCRGTRTRNLLLDVVWSDQLGAPNGVSNHVKITRDSLDVIEEGYRFLRLTTDLPDIELEGYVIRLHREAYEDEGDVTIITPFEGVHRKVKIKGMSEALYQHAIDAHAQEARIRIKGDVQRVGVYYQMTNPRRVPTAE